MKQKPAAFFTDAAAALITPGNFEDDLGASRDCDWIIEAVAENLEIKRDLLAQVADAARARRRSSPPTPAAFRWRRSPKASTPNSASTSWARTSSIRRATCTWWK